MLKLSLFRQGPKKPFRVNKTPKLGTTLKFQSPKENFERTFDLRNEDMGTCISGASNDSIDEINEEIENQRGQIQINTKTQDDVQGLEQSTRQSSSPNSCADIESSSDEGTNTQNEKINEIEIVSSFEQINFENSNVPLNQTANPKLAPDEEAASLSFESESCLPNDNIIIISQHDFCTIPTISEDLLSNLSWNPDNESPPLDNIQDPIADLEIEEDLLEYKQQKQIVR